MELSDWILVGLPMLLVSSLPLPLPHLLTALFAHPFLYMQGCMDPVLTCCEVVLGYM